MGYCRSCLKTTAKSFCPKCRKLLFKNALISHVLPFSRPEFNEAKLTNVKRLSISGMQTKYSLRLQNNQLELTAEKGEYIIKPVPVTAFKYAEAIPANEHITMQIARQVFGIETAENCLAEFNDGTPAYIVKRFDIFDNGRKLLQEDFAQIAGLSEENGGKNYKYDFSYEKIANLITKYAAAYKIEIEKYFAVVLFNYLICNGDAHVKNFSLYRNETFGDYTLTPCYDLANTSLHVPGERDTALDLFDGGYQTEADKYDSKYTRPDFIEFGIRIGMAPKRILKILTRFSTYSPGVEALVKKSFLPEDLQALYVDSYMKRVERLQG